MRSIGKCEYTAIIKGWAGHKFVCMCICMYVVGCNGPAVSVVHHPCCCLTLCNRISGDLRSREQLNWLAERQNVEANY